MVSVILAKEEFYDVSGKIVGACMYLKGFEMNKDNQLLDKAYNELQEAIAKLTEIETKALKVV